MITAAQLRAVWPFGIQPRQLAGVSSLPVQTIQRMQASDRGRIDPFMNRIAGQNLAAGGLMGRARCRLS